MDPATGSDLMIDEDDSCVIDREGLGEMFFIAWVVGHD